MFIVTQFIAEDGGGMQVSNLLIGSFLKEKYKLPIVYIGNNNKSKSHCDIYLNQFSSVILTQIYFFCLLMYSFFFSEVIISLDDGILRCAGLLPFTCKNIIVINSGSLAVRKSKTLLGKISIFLSKISTKRLKANLVSQSIYDQLKYLKLSPSKSFILGRPCSKNVSYKKEINLKTPIKFITYGRLDHDKNIINLLKAFINIDKYESITLDIFGDGPLLKKVISLSNSSKNINYFGEINHFVLMKKLEEYDYFICVTKNETFGRSWIEAGSKGIPFIGSKVGNLSYLIKDQINGYSSGLTVSEICKTLHKVIKNHFQEYYTLSKNSSETAQEYTYENIFKKLEKYLSEIL